MHPGDIKYYLISKAGLVCLIPPWGQSWEKVFQQHKCLQFIARVLKVLLFGSGCGSVYVRTTAHVGVAVVGVHWN